MEAAEASKRGLSPLGIYRGMAVAGCEPDEMGIGPVFAIPRLLENAGLSQDDIDLWELKYSVLINSELNFISINQQELSNVVTLL